jgi:hypothetical protein
MVWWFTSGKVLPESFREPQGWFWAKWRRAALT